jgi:hypothetical protein
MEAAGIEPAQDSPGFIYFIRAIQGPRHSARVKIGWTRDPRKRLKDLQTGSPVELYLIGAIPGGREDERAMHERFALSRMHGEWFALTGEMHELVIERGELVCREIETARANRAYFDAREKAAASSGEAASPTSEVTTSAP